MITKAIIPVNYLALVGWSPESNEEILSLDEMVKQFSFDRVSKSGGVFDAGIPAGVLAASRPFALARARPFERNRIDVVRRCASGGVSRSRPEPRHRRGIVILAGVSPSRAGPERRLHDG